MKNKSISKINKDIRFYNQKLKEKKKEYKFNEIYDMVEGYDFDDLISNLNTLKFEYKQKFEIINFQITLGRCYAFIKYKTDADGRAL